MTDGEILASVLASAVSFGAGFGALVKYVADRYFADRKEDRDDRKAERENDRAATTAVATAMTTMALKFDSFEKQLAAVQWDVHEISGVHSAVPEPIPAPAPTRNTPAKGRPHTYGDGRDR